MAAKRTATAVWENDLVHGHGTVKGTIGAFGEMAVSWAARTEAPGGKTSPEELLAAAHAACFSMALSGGLGRIQKPPERLTVSATATFDKVGDAWKVTTMELDVTGKVPGISAAEFQQAAQAAGQGCPISNALKGNVAISVPARESGSVPRRNPTSSGVSSSSWAIAPARCRTSTRLPRPEAAEKIRSRNGSTTSRLLAVDKWNRCPAFFASESRVARRARERPISPRNAGKDTPALLPAPGPSCKARETPPVMSSDA